MFLVRFMNSSILIRKNIDYSFTLDGIQIEYSLYIILIYVYRKYEISQLDFSTKRIIYNTYRFIACRLYISAPSISDMKRSSSIMILLKYIKSIQIYSAVLQLFSMSSIQKKYGKNVFIKVLFLNLCTIELSSLGESDKMKT